MNFWDMSSPGIGLVVSIPNIVLSTRFMMILWPFQSPWDTIMQSELIEILFYFYIGKINDLTISSVYFFRNQNLYECLLMQLPKEWSRTIGVTTFDMPYGLLLSGYGE